MDTLTSAPVADVLTRLFDEAHSPMTWQAEKMRSQNSWHRRRPITKGCITSTPTTF